jgi:hypothetical protein
VAPTAKKTDDKATEAEAKPAKVVEEEPKAEVDLDASIASLNSVLDEIADDGVEWTQVRFALNAATEQAKFLHWRAKQQ